MRAVPLEGSRVVVVGRLQQRTWTAEDGSTRSTVEVVAEELGPSLRWTTATTTRVSVKDRCTESACGPRWGQAERST